MTTCSFCGHEYSNEDSRSGCSGCPMSKACKKTKCPNCGYEMPEEPALIKLIRKKWGKKP